MKTGEPPKKDRTHGTRKGRIRNGEWMVDKALISIACNEVATWTAAVLLSGGKPTAGPMLDLTYAGASAMLEIKQTWTMARHKEMLYRARRTKPMWMYCHERYGWMDDVFDLVYWHLVGRVCKKLAHMQKMQTCKIMYGWLPTGPMKQFIMGINQCPGCGCIDKIILHIF